MVRSAPFLRNISEVRQLGGPIVIGQSDLADQERSKFSRWKKIMLFPKGRRGAHRPYLVTVTLSPSSAAGAEIVTRPVVAFRRML